MVFLEKVYDNAMMIELKKLGLECKNQVPLSVYYEKTIIGDYFADIIVADKVIVELKAVEYLLSKHEAQLVNYLRASDIEVGLLLNFGEVAEKKRRVLTNDYKNHN